MGEVLEQWEALLTKAGTLARIDRALSALAASTRMPDACTAVWKRVTEDLVWCRKESPSLITAADASEMMDCLRGRHGR
jgi:hypothetical protein